MTIQIPLPHTLNPEYSFAPVIAEPDGQFATDKRRLNLNESAWPPSPKAQAAMVEAVADTARYPDHSCSALTRRLSVRTGISEDRICFGTGSSELLSLIPRILITPGDEAILPQPTFPACGAGVRLAGGAPVNIPVAADGRNDIPAMLEAITDKTRLFYLCTPNNPTGGAVKPEELIRAVFEVPKTCLLAIDEAYFEFAETALGEGVLDILQQRSGPWIVTRSFSKAYGLAGIRVGYAFTSNTDLRTAFSNLRTSFNISRVAVAGAAAALDDDPYLNEMVQRTVVERERLASGLKALGFSPYPSQANFVTAGSVGPADRFVQALAAQNIMISALPWPNEKGCLKITVGKPDDTDAVLGALEQELKN